MVSDYCQLYLQAVKTTVQQYICVIIMTSSRAKFNFDDFSFFTELDWTSEGRDSFGIILLNLLQKVVTRWRSKKTQKHPCIS